MRLWVWRGIRIELPEDWEMLQFSRSAEAGRCAWADRYQFRAELSWQRVSGPLDMERLASDYAAKLKLDGTMPDAAATRVGEWHGLRGRDGGLLTSRFSRYFAEEGCLVELVLLWPGQADAALEAGVLGTVGCEPLWHGRMRRWRAFGLDLLASEGLELHECSVQPALARLEFWDARGTRREAFERLGMVPQWLRGSVREWLVRQLPQGARVVREGRSDQAGHEVVGVEALCPGGVFRRASSHAAAAWLCPADGRLYHVALLAPCSGMRPACPEVGEAADGSLAATCPARRRLGCCEGMALGG